MSINKKLNEEYFKTKKKHKEGYKKRKLTFKRGIINIAIVWSFILLYSLISKSCEKRIEENINNNVISTTSKYNNPPYSAL